MSEWKYPGAKWWKFDFHAHTPASNDFMQGCNQKDKDQVEPEGWLRKFMEKDIDCVAITDHNSGAWVDRLKQKLGELEQDKPDWYRPLYLFPSVEISVQGGVHLLAIFDPKKETVDIVSLLGAVKYQGTRGHSDGVTEESFTKVVDIVHERDGIAVPAHVDGEKGLFKAMNGESLGQALKNPNICAMELWDSDFEKPQLYKNEKLRWTEVKGSDTHDFDDDDFGAFTWVKMDEPSIEGLKLALIDGEVSVNRDMNEDPNRHAEYVIEKIIIENAKYMGRPEALICRFSPFLNAIIGGRGSGKSTLLEFMRFVLRRDKEIPKPLTGESEKYFNIDGDNLLLKNSRLSLIYRKDNLRYRLNWSAKADTASLESEADNGWQAEPGDIKSLFPAYIYSQKQIFALAQQPDALLGIIDKDRSVEYEVFEKKREALVNEYKRMMQQVQELERKIAENDKLTGLLNDVSRQIEQIEKSGHKDVLQNYRHRQRQLSEIRRIEDSWQAMVSSLEEARENIEPVDIDEQIFDAHPEILQAIKEPNDRWQSIQEKLTDLSEEALTTMDKWQREKTDGQWMNNLKIDTNKYEQLRTQLAQQDVDPDRYPLLLQQQTQFKKELTQIDGYNESTQKLTKSAKEILAELQQNREELTKKRACFLKSVLKNNQSVGIEVKSFGQRWQGIEERIRRLLQCHDERFSNDFEELRKIYDNNALDKITIIKRIKDRLSEIYIGKQGAKDYRFGNHIKNLPQESISDLITWFPQDDLKITFGDNQNIQQGSPGQKTAALLAFILSYGSEPLLLDQPEDDLDNELIYEMIVEQLRETKSKRQIIVVTHNANIVVNGDAEMVLALRVANGQTHVHSPASIQSHGIREKICDILEGGQWAFEQRYKRIHLENEHV